MKKDFEKMKWHVKMHKKCHSITEKKKCHFSSFGGTPMRFRLAKCLFWNGGKMKKDFEKMKWHVKMHKKCHSIREKKK